MTSNKDKNKKRSFIGFLFDVFGLYLRGSAKICVLMKWKLRGEMPELADGARLEIVCSAKSGTEGSNPSLSAMHHVGCMAAVNST